MLKANPVTNQNKWLASFNQYHFISYKKCTLLFLLANSKPPKSTNKLKQFEIANNNLGFWMTDKNQNGLSFEYIVLNRRRLED